MEAVQTFTRCIHGYDTKFDGIVGHSGRSTKKTAMKTREDRSMSSVRRWRKGGAVALFWGAVLFSAVSVVAEDVPDLTTGYYPTNELTAAYSDFNVGATGLRGWCYHRGTGSSLSRQLLVTAVDVDPESPAYGLIATNDVILGADGTGAAGEPALFSYDSRVAIADAINAAEARDVANNLRLLYWREGSGTNTVTLTLEHMGAYSSTAPYDCEKSSNIVEKCVAYFAQNGDAGRGGLGALILLGFNDPSHPSNAVYQALARDWAHEQILTQEQIDGLNAGEVRLSAWNSGFMLLTLAEYYQQTGDTNVYPTLEAIANGFALRQSSVGTAGHKFADLTHEGGFNGSMTGYGAINMSGVHGFLGMELARDAGVTNSAIDAAIGRAEKFFGSYAGKSDIPYGEHDYSAGMWDMNGRHAAAAMAFAKLTNRVDETRYFAKMTTCSSKNRQNSHAGPFFNYVWPSLGAAVAGTNSAAHYFSRTRWLYDLSRRWDGGISYDVFGYGGNSYYSLAPELTTLMTYLLPRRQLYITGRDFNPSVAISAGELAETVAAEDFDATLCDTNQLIQALYNWAPKVRLAAAKEIVERPEATALVPTLHAMATDTLADRFSRNAACAALSYIRDNSSIPILVSLLTDSDSYVRHGAGRGLYQFLKAYPSNSFDPATVAAVKVYLDDILVAAATTGKAAFPIDDDDPLQLAHGSLGQLLFVGLLRTSIDGVDRDLLYAAMRALAKTPNGGFRGTLQFPYRLLNYDEVIAVADAIVDTVRRPAPFDGMFAGGIRVVGGGVLQSYGIADGVPAGMEMADRKPSDAANLLKKYAGDCLTVEPDPQALFFLTDQLINNNTDVSTAIAAILNDPAPDTLTPLKTISSVTPDDPTLTLPARGTMLRVSATNDVRAASNTVYTWRMVYGGGDVSFTPNGVSASTNTYVYFTAGVPGNYRFEVTMSDDYGYTEVRDTVDVTLYDVGGSLPANSAPTADSQEIAAGSVLATPVQFTGSDPEGLPLAFYIVTDPTHGTLSGDAPDLLYRSKFGYTGNDSLLFEVIDSQGVAATGTVSISVYTGIEGLTVYEPFDYSPGTLQGQSGLSEVGLDGVWTNPGNTMGVSDDGSFSYAALPSKGNHLYQLTGGMPPESQRTLNAAALARDRVFEDGSEMWFSVVVGVSSNVNRTNARFWFGFRDLDGTANAGFELYRGRALIPRLNDDYGAIGGSTTVPDKINWPAITPQLVVGHCVWGETAGDLDTIELYRVLEGTGDGRPIVSDDLVMVPLTTFSANVAQAGIDTMYLQFNCAMLVDEMRIGPTYESVLLGTVALTEDL